MGIATPTAVEDLSARVGGRYSLLIRENYLDIDDPDEFRDFFKLLVKESVGGGRTAFLFELSRSDDWREAVIALQLASVWLVAESRHGRFTRTWAAKGRRIAEVATRYESMIVERPSFAGSLLFRPALMLLTFLRRGGAVAAFLEPGRYVEDCFDAYAAALAADRLIDSTDKPHGSSGVPSLRLNPSAELTARLTGELGDVTEELIASAQRFADGVAFWGGSEYRVKFVA